MRARAGALLLLLALLPARARHRTYADRPAAERPFFLPMLESSDEAVNYAQQAHLSEAMLATLGRLLGRISRHRSLFDRRLLARFGRGAPAGGGYGLQERHYAVVEQALDDALVDTLARFYAGLIDAGALPFGDGQSRRFQARARARTAATPTTTRPLVVPSRVNRPPARFPGVGSRARSRARKAHNEKLSRVLHFDLEPLVSRLVGVPVKATYSYFGGYVNGSSLPLHTDKPACEYTVSLCLAREPADAPWPILVQKKAEPCVSCGGPKAHAPRADEMAALDWRPGGFGVFKGRHHSHMRDAFDGVHARYLLLHYVPVDEAAHAAHVAKFARNCSACEIREPG
jgi:hypothetical protein